MSLSRFRRPAIVAKATEKGPQVQDVIGYGIASVFTPETKRGKGYAKHMMRLLHWIISPPSTVQFPSSWGAPPTSPIGNASFSVLYSDVGPTFYSHCGPDNTPGTGWIVRGNRQTRWDLHADHPVPLSSVHGEILSEEQVNQLWEDDAKIIKVEAGKHVISGSKGKIAFAFLPTNGVGWFSIRRNMKIGADHLPTLPTTKWGIQLVPKGELPAKDAKIPFANWTFELRGKLRVMLVTRLRVSQAAFPDLLRKVFDVAKEEDIGLLEIWNLPEELESLAQSLGGVTATRDDHLPSFKWYGPESHDDVDWLFNEK